MLIQEILKEIVIMKKAWKWVIGIVLGLVVLALLVGAGFMLRNNFHAYRGELPNGRSFTDRGPGMMPYGGFEQGRGPGMMGNGGFGHGRGPGMMVFGGFFGGLFSLGFLALVVLGIIWLVRNLRKPQTIVAAPAAVPAAVVNPCRKCGKPLQDEWRVCPHCGTKV
jgi:hypothetical protein